jgi:hypothetical protein
LNSRDDADGDEPEPEEDVDLLVDDVDRENTLKMVGKNLINHFLFRRNYLMSFVLAPLIL